jgi:hypothetical protein
MLKQYSVVWKIDIYAEDEKEAAIQALKIQRDPDSIAVVFDVTRAGEKKYITKHIDLEEEK